MALMGFLLIAGLGITEGTAGQLVSAFTLGTVLATIPLIALTRQTATSEASGENADVANSKLGVSLGR
jgi:predicted MFS family arabinose efflux permease